MSLDLSPLDRELLIGAHGAGAALAMRLLLRFVEAVAAATGRAVQAGQRGATISADL
jgi:predicted aconitase